MNKTDIDSIEYQSLLYDFYGGLLGDPKREIMDLYHEDDMSLSEIAEELGQTRQGVHYTLKKAEAELEKFEEKLKLVERYLENLKTQEKASMLIGELRESLKSSDLPEASGADIDKKLKKLTSLIEKISEV